jgi:hypothetical protein
MKAQNLTENWLSTIDLSTYNISLYLCNPDVWGDPARFLDKSEQSTLQSGKAVIISQSGVTTKFATDNLQFTSYLRQGTQTLSTTISVVQFEIQEVLGFDLLDLVLSYSREFNHSTFASAKFVIKLEFKGRNPDTKQPVKYPGVFFFSLLLKEIQAKTTVDGTRYGILAFNNSNYALIQSKINSSVTVTKYKTVGEFITSTAKALNDFEVESRKEPGNDAPVKSYKKWEIIIDETGTTEYTRDKTQDEMMFRSNVGTKASTGFNLNEKLMHSGAGSSGGLQGIDLNAVDVPDQIKGVQNTENQSDNDKLASTTTITAGSNIANWLVTKITKEVPEWRNFVLQSSKNNKKVPKLVASPEVSFGTEIDPKTNQPEIKVKITLSIHYSTQVPATTPAEQNAWLENKKKQVNWIRQNSDYILKKYHWIYSGKNSEVLNFELDFNNIFFVPLDPQQGSAYPGPAETHRPSKPQQVSTVSNKPIFISQRDDFEPFVIENLQYAYDTQSAKDQHVTESNKQDPEVERYQQLASRELDAINFTAEIRGDPFWIGTPGNKTAGTTLSSSNFKGSSQYVIFLTYKPTEAVTYTEGQHRGKLDYISSGLYEIVKVESKFMGGEFTQTLHGLRNRNVVTLLIGKELENL